DEGAGDQGIMFGYACNETPELMPAPIYYAHAILQSLSEARRSGRTPDLGPDAKSQVTLEYVNGKPVRATSVVVSTQHSTKVDQDEVRAIVRPHVERILPKGWMCGENQFYVNPTGRFVVGGPDGDAGLTGRKIIVDTYGGAAPHGGGAFSGKDPSKVDRSAAYAARYLAKNVVAAGLAERCLIQLSYAIGVAKPLSIYVDTVGTAKVDEAKLAATLPELMDLSPRGIRTKLGLNRPIYARTSAYGHFGRKPEADGGFSWERADLADALRRALS
ncbi:MAG: methionine adenosyltransferase, partial [Alphaproteobacteria bacterium]